METDRTKLCGCKGIRTCLKCERICGIPTKHFELELGELGYVFCPHCNKCWPGWDINDYESHPNHTGEPFELEGIYIELDFLSEKEELDVSTALDNMPWDPSQSGRRKQNHGPKCNFKKKKLRVGDFKGFPKCTQFIQAKFSNVDILQNYITIEQCSLEYDPTRGASIDPHIDDCWIWGERIVTVNLMADSVLTLKPYRGTKTKYNLNLVPNEHLSKEEPRQNVVVRVPMPQRSLLVLYGHARYNWEHAVLREDISQRRVCLAYREFTPPYLPGGELSNESLEILDKAKMFW